MRNLCQAVLPVSTTIVVVVETIGIVVRDVLNTTVVVGLAGAVVVAMRITGRSTTVARLTTTASMVVTTVALKRIVGVQEVIRQGSNTALEITCIYVMRRPIDTVALQTAGIVSTVVTE